jgi:4'-phosphopantetheinyl transferase
MRLDNSSIHLWQADKADYLAAQLQADCLPWLSEKELLRYQRYQFAGSKQEYLAGQMLIRTVLSEYSDAAPPDWEIGQLENGKPFIILPELAEPIHFNLSHSEDRLVLAISRHALTGVDIESVKAKRRIEQIAARHFSAAELEQLSSLEHDEKLLRFYEFWTLKEAFIKAKGAGLKHSLQSFGFKLGKGELGFWIEQAEEPADQFWQFWQLHVSTDYCLALACRPEDSQKISQLLSFQRTSLQNYHAIDTKLIRSN